jgi:hypothetical protein
LPCRNKEINKGEHATLFLWRDMSPATPRASITLEPDDFPLCELFQDTEPRSAMTKKLMDLHFLNNTRQIRTVVKYKQHHFWYLNKRFELPRRLPCGKF